MALLDSNNIVIRVVAIPEMQPSEFNKYLEKINFSGNWMLCDRYAYRGKRRFNTDQTNGTSGATDQTAFRKNYPLKGYSYDSVTDSFIEPKPYPSWILDSDGGFWKPPIEKPNVPVEYGKKYQWDEASLSWIQV